MSDKRAARPGGRSVGAGLQELTRKADIGRMCPTNHNATCTAVLSHAEDRPGGLIARLVCESCNEVLQVIGFVEHHLEPILTIASPEPQR